MQRKVARLSMCLKCPKKKRRESIHLYPTTNLKEPSRFNSKLFKNFGFFGGLFFNRPDETNLMTKQFHIRFIGRCVESWNQSRNWDRQFQPMWLASTSLQKEEIYLQMFWSFKQRLPNGSDSSHWPSHRYRRERQTEVVVHGRNRPRKSAYKEN